MKSTEVKIANSAGKLAVPGKAHQQQEKEEYKANRGAKIATQRNYEDRGIEICHKDIHREE